MIKFFVILVFIVVYSIIEEYINKALGVEVISTSFFRYVISRCLTMFGAGLIAVVIFGM